MSKENEDLTEIIINFNKDFQQFSEIVSSVSHYEQKIQIHVSKLKKSKDSSQFAVVADIASKLANGWITISEATKSIEENLKELNLLYQKGKPCIIQTEQSKTNENSLNSPSKGGEHQAEIFECASKISLVTVKQETDKTDTQSQNSKLAVVCSDTKQNENNREEKTSYDIETAKQGTIRLVPLQNLLSTSGQNLHSSSSFELTISDSDEEDILFAKKNSTNSPKKQELQIFELSDSEEEQHINKLQTVIETKEKEDQLNSSEKPRKKFTPLRSSKEKSVLNLKRKQSCMSSDEDIVKVEEENRISPEIEQSDQTIKERKPNIVFTDNLSISNTSSLAKNFNDDSCTRNDQTDLSKELVCTSSYSSASSTTETVRKKLATLVKNSLNRKSFEKKCIVRIKRALLVTVNSTNLDVHKFNTHSNSISKISKTVENIKHKMDSSSDSELEIFEDKNNSNNDSSSSEIIVKRKKRIFQRKEKESSASSDSESNSKSRTTSEAHKKRKNLSQSNSSSDDKTDEANDDDDEKNKKRKKIRKLINEKNLDDGTKRATKEEEERKKRIEERQKMYNQIYIKPENEEIDQLILDFDESTKQPLLKVDNGLLKKLKPHQVKGVKFMWDACFETIKDCQDKPGSGCILAHCMGLGKTMQVVTLAHTLLTHYEVTHVDRVLIISPLSTLNNWAREFHHWIKFAKNKDIEIYDMSKYKDKNTRVFKLEEWFTEGGVCIVGYDMYRILSNDKTKGMRKKQKESLQKSLVDPGPDVVVCDEGHLLKNEKTSLSKAVTKMRTKRRIVLTGTPLQNNLKEYYCMIQFIKPNLLGTYKEYLNRFVNPITNGQYTDSTARDIRLMKHRSHILHKMLEACIQRRDYSVLAPYLPPKHEYVVFVTLSDIQKQLYGHYMTAQREIIGEASGNPGKGAKLFQDFQDLRRIWTHPMNLRVNSDIVIRKKMAQYDSDESIKDFIDDNSTGSSSSDSDSSSIIEADVNEATSTRTRHSRAQKGLSDNDSDCLEVQAKDDPSEWWTKFVDDCELNNIHHSPKLVLLMTLLQRCEEIGDKVLVFSQSLQSLDVIEHFLSLIDRQTRGEKIDGNVGSFKGYWEPGVNYFRLDGSRTVETREHMCKNFNDLRNLNARLFLISTRAGGLGINLVAANRVVIFDVSWNPSHDTQSIFRVYRFGQIKPCYIYRLIALGTMEQKVYERQVAKQATAKRVIDEQQISRHYNQSDLQELYSYELEPSSPREIPILPKDRLFAELLSNHEKLLFKYHEHDSLLENEDSENLTEEERQAAWDEYEAEKTRPPQPSMQYMSYDRQAYLGNFGNQSGSVTSNKIFGFRSDILLRLLNMKGSQDHPELTSAQVIQLVPEYLQRLYLEMNNGDPTLYKELLELHKSLEAPGGMYMNPLLFANQTTVHGPIMPQYGGPYGQIHPGTSNFNSNEVYEVD